MICIFAFKKMSNDMSKTISNIWKVIMRLVEKINNNGKYQKFT